MDGDLLSALIAALVGGAIGSAITAWASVAIARSKRREEAAAALWSYHYSLTGVAQTAAVGPDWEVSLVKAEQEEVNAALRAAYPYAGYLGRRSREMLFTNAWVDMATHEPDPWERREQVYAEFSKLAHRLENDLDWVFPRRALDRLRVVGRWLKERKKS